MGKALFFLRSGGCDVVKFSDSGEETIVGAIDIFACFGEQSFLLNSASLATVRSRIYSEILRLGRFDFDHVCAMFPALRTHVLGVQREMREHYKGLPYAQKRAAARRNSGVCTRVSRRGYAATLAVTKMVFRRSGGSARASSESPYGSALEADESEPARQCEAVCKAQQRQAAKERSYRPDGSSRAGEEPAQEGGSPAGGALAEGTAEGSVAAGGTTEELDTPVMQIKPDNVVLSDVTTPAATPR